MWMCVIGHNSFTYPQPPCLNSTLLLYIVNFPVNTLPFGGIGNSGMGAYHGKFSFNTFSHSRAYVYKNQSLEALNA